MSDRVLVALDGSTQARKGLEYAADNHPEATLVCFHAIDPFDRDPENAKAQPLTDAWLEAERDRADALFEEALEVVDHEGRVERETTVGSPAESIVAYAEEEDVDLVVVGSYGLGEAARLRLGSVAEVVVRRTPVPVLVVR
ncbi:universal stress protein [Natrialbaceae archaeon A-gly3]